MIKYYYNNSKLKPAVHSFETLISVQQTLKAYFTNGLHDLYSTFKTCNLSSFVAKVSYSKS